MSSGGADAPKGPGASRALFAVLSRSRSLGFLGPGSIEHQIQHAQVFLEAVRGVPRILDLGSGGGLPGLVLVDALGPESQLVLLDAGRRRCEFLRTAVAELGASDRTAVHCERAEVAARDPDLRGSFGAVVARSFGPPAVTAECGAGFLSGPSARLLVSEPPVAEVDRWPTNGLDRLGLRPGPRISALGASVQILQPCGPVRDEVPRRNGSPAKRPYF